MKNKLVFHARMFNDDNTRVGGAKKEPFIELLFIDKQSVASKKTLFDVENCEIECWEEWGNTIPIAGIACFSKPEVKRNFLHSDKATLARSAPDRSVLTMRYDADNKEWVFECAGKETRLPHKTTKRVKCLVFEW